MARLSRSDQVLWITAEVVVVRRSCCASTRELRWRRSGVHTEKQQQQPERCSLVCAHETVQTCWLRWDRSDPLLLLLLLPY